MYRPKNPRALCMDLCVGVATPHSPHVQPFSSPINHTFSRSIPDVWCKKIEFKQFLKPWTACQPWYFPLEIQMQMQFSMLVHHQLQNASQKKRELLSDWHGLFFLPSNGSVSDGLPAVQSRVLRDSSLSGLVQQLTQNSGSYLLFLPEMRSGEQQTQTVHPQRATVPQQYGFPLFEVLCEKEKARACLDMFPKSITTLCILVQHPCGPQCFIQCFLKIPRTFCE